MLIIPKFVKETNDFHEELQAYKPDYQRPTFSDFWITLIICPIFTLAKLLCNKIARPFYQKRIHSKYTGTIRTDKIEKCSTNLFKFLYFLAWQSVCFYFVLPYTNFQTPRFFGTGNISFLYQTFPFDIHSKRFQLYYLVSAAYHLESTIGYLIAKPKSDFYEMITHHFAHFSSSCSLTQETIKISEFSSWWSWITQMFQLD